MKYHVTYERNGIYHGNIAIADTPESVRDWFANHKPDARIVAIEPVRSDDIKPGKPVIIIQRDSPCS